MRIASCLAFGLASLALAACSKAPEPTAAPAPPPVPHLNLSYSEMEPSPPSKYALTTCVVSGKPLREGGKKPFAIAWKGYEVQFCCKDCLKDFASDPEGYYRKVNPKAIFESR